MSQHTPHRKFSSGLPSSLCYNASHPCATAYMCLDSQNLRSECQGNLSFFNLFIKSKGYFKKYIFCYNHAVVFTVSTVISFMNEFVDYKAHVINLAEF